MFGYARSGDIYDLNITNSSVSGYRYVGGIVGYTRGTDVYNCTYSGDVYASRDCAGGIIGEAYSSGDIYNCSVYGNVKVYGHTGGIVGQFWSSGTSSITDCKNFASISGGSSYTTYVGGIAGWIRTYTTISNCINFGEIDARCNRGGIAGDNLGVIENCINIGDIIGDGYRSASAGGIAGTSSGTISKCYNEGEFSPSEALYYLGGIVGLAEDGLVMLLLDMVEKLEGLQVKLIRE